MRQNYDSRSKPLLSESTTGQRKGSLPSTQDMSQQNAKSWAPGINFQGRNGSLHNKFVKCTLRNCQTILKWAQNKPEHKVGFQKMKKKTQKIFTTLGQAKLRIVFKYIRKKMKRQPQPEYIRTYVCMCVYIYTYILYTHAHTHTYVHGIPSQERFIFIIFKISYWLIINQ